MFYQRNVRNETLEYHDDVASISVRKLKDFLWLLVFMIVLLNGYESSLAGNTLTPERFFAVPLLIFTLFILLLLREPLPISHASFFLMAWLLVTFIASAITSVSGWSLKMYLGQLLAVSFYFITVWCRPDYNKIFSSKIFLLFAWFFGPLLSIVYISSFYLDLPGFMQQWLQEGSGGTRIRATIYEANLMGVLLILFNLLVISLGFTRKVWWWFLLIGLHFSLLFTFSRVPWVSYAIAIMLYGILSTSKKYSIELLSRYFLIVIVSSIGLLIIGVVVYIAFGDLEIIGRLHSLRTRLIMWELALNSFIESPIIGNGIFSFSELNPQAPSLVGSDTHRSAWISNLILALFHDTGLIGAILFFSFMFWVLLRGAISVRVSATNNGGNRYFTKVGAALVSFGVALFITGQSIPAHSLAFFWVSLALIERYSTVSFQIGSK